MHKKFPNIYNYKIELKKIEKTHNSEFHGTNL